MSTERIARLQTLLERIKKNAPLPKRSTNLVFGGAKPAHNDVSTAPAVPAAKLGLAPPAKPADVAAAPMTPIRNVEVEAPSRDVAASRTPTLTGSAHVPTLSGMRSPYYEPEPEPVDATAQIDVVEELDIDEIDVVDITTESPPPPDLSAVEPGSPVANFSIPAAEVRDDELSWSEPPDHDKHPDSSPRPRAAASTLDEALAEAAESGPLKTPPPESGRQPTDGVYAAVIPTPEQLGETVDLEAPTSTELELDLTQAEGQKPKEELEFELPPRPSILELPTREEIPTYTDEVAEPETRAPEQSQVRSLAEEVDTVETPAFVLSQDAPSPATDRDSQPPTAELTVRKTEGKEVAPEFVFASRKFEPKSFAELLDASLTLAAR